MEQVKENIMKNRFDSILLQIIYVVFCGFAIWSMIDSSWKYSARAEMNSAFFLDVGVILFSLLMFGSGFVMLANEVNQKIANKAVHRVAAIRMVLAILFGLVTQWFFVQVAIEYLN